MKKGLLIIILLLIFAGLLQAQQQEQKKIRLALATGFEQQYLNWSIAGNLAGQNPNIYSELKFKNVGGQFIGINLQWDIWKKIVLMGDFTHQFISSGTVSDNDYSNDDRTGQIYGEAFSANKGFAQLWAVAIGYWVFNKRGLTITPFAGYGISKQNLFLLDRNGQFNDLNSTYNPRWKGAFVKVIANLQLFSKLKANVNFTYNQIKYTSTADWNLIERFQHPVSYRHNANGFGLQYGGSLSYPISKSMALKLEGTYYNWQTGKGTDQLYLTSGEVDQTQLNSVHRSGYTISGGLILNL